jgi:hypothetical protein
MDAWPQRGVMILDRRGNLTAEGYVSFDHSWHLTAGLLTTNIWPQVTFERGTFDRKWHLTMGHLTTTDIWPRDFWPQVTFEHGTFDHKWHLTAGLLTTSDIWPQDFWPQVTFDCGTFDRKWHLTTGFLTVNEDLNQIKFVKLCMDRQFFFQSMRRMYEFCFLSINSSLSDIFYWCMFW